MGFYKGEDGKSYYREGLCLVVDLKALEKKLAEVRGLEQLRSLPKSKRPPDAPRVRGTRQERGYGADYQRKRARKLKTDPLCEVCGASWTAEIDHRDGNPHNNAWENLCSICVACHLRKHNKLTKE